ncbi:hypothetical protein [Absidia glauca]|uniref:RNA polymerase II elongation factor ELL N-terminal domain-containing protein n=1 Tax=Absidia glauca TaxID=4829 RepID=A0A168NSB3_ABSGL|nr:hypothetical protein [Absidia glauca]
MTNKKQVFSVRLNRDAYNLIMHQSQPMRLEIGDSSSFMFIGDRPFDLNLKREQSTIHVYEKDKLTRLDDDNRIRFVGNVTHAGHMKQVLSEEDKKRVRSITEQTEKEKNARSIELLDAPRIPTPTKLYNNSNTSPTTTVTTKMPSPSIKRNKLLSPSTNRPSPSSSSSSKLKASVNTTTPSPSGATTSTPNGSSSAAAVASRLEGAALAGLRERLIHLLALDHRPTEQLMQMLKVASVDLLPLLKKVAVLQKSVWCLRPEIFKDIRIWDWTRYDDKERATVRKKAELAYDHLDLPRNAPERANLIQRKPRKPSPKQLIPPPSQHTPILGNGGSNSNTPTKAGTNTPSVIHTSSSTTTSNSSNHSNTKRARADVDQVGKLPGIIKKRKGETTPISRSTEPTPSTIPATKQTSSSSSSSSSPSSSSTTPAKLISTKKPPTERKKQKIPAGKVIRTKALSSKLTRSATITVGQRLGTTDATQPTRYGGTDNEISSTDIEEDDDHDGISNKRSRMDDKLYVPPTIQTQMDFDRLCREHQHTQQAYIRFKKTFSQKHPIFIQALAAVNEKDKTEFVRKLKAYYQSKGGDMDNWRHLMQLSRQFNGTHAKINMMWTTIETAYRQKKFSLRLHRKSSSSSSAASSASSSSPPIPSSSSSVSAPYNKYTRR